MQWHLTHQELDTSEGPDLADVVVAQRERVKTLADLVSSSRYFYEDVTEYDEKAVRKQFKTDTAGYLSVVHDVLAELPEWEDEAIHDAIQRACEQLGVKLGKVGPPIRIAVTGSGSSPSLEVTLRLIGRERSLQRIQRAVNFIQKSG